MWLASLLVISVESSEPYVPQVIEYIGSNNLILGSDYPHMDHQPDVIDKMLEYEGKLSKETIEKILWHNPSRFYGLV